MKIYVGNFPFSMEGEALSEFFGQYGEVDQATVITDRSTGRSRGFGFVEMANDEEARKAIQAANGIEVDGRSLSVSEAKPRNKQGDRGGSRGRSGRRD